MVPCPFILVVVVVIGFSAWLNKMMARNSLHIQTLADRTGLHANTIYMYLQGDFEPRMSNLILIIAVFSEIEDRSPTQIMFEAVTSLSEMQMIEDRWRRKTKRHSK